MAKIGRPPFARKFQDADPNMVVVLMGAERLSTTPGPCGFPSCDNEATQVVRRATAGEVLVAARVCDACESDMKFVLRHLTSHELANIVPSKMRAQVVRLYTKEAKRLRQEALDLATRPATHTDGEPVAMAVRRKLLGAAGLDYVVACLDFLSQKEIAMPDQEAFQELT